jgi:hypothetical protein
VPGIVYLFQRRSPREAFHPASALKAFEALIKNNTLLQRQTQELGFCANVEPLSRCDVGGKRQAVTSTVRCRPLFQG